MDVAVTGNSTNVNACICRGCPTFQEWRLSGVLFCAREGVSESIKQRGCICPDCAVWKNNKLTNLYYCANGKSR